MTYLVFDIETVPNEELLQAAEGVTLQEYRAAKETDFIPVTYVKPVSIVVGRVSRSYELEALVALEEAVQQQGMLFDSEDPEKALTRAFWGGWESYNNKGAVAFVTFNGRRYDIPVMECAAYRHGISVSAWFNMYAKSWEQNRNRYNLGAHFDIAEVLSSFGSFPMAGGLNMLAKAIGMPGKMDVCGSAVEQLYNDGNLDQITRYCKCDVLDTYMVFLRTLRLMGRISDDGHERRLVQQALGLAESCNLKEYVANANYM